MNTLILPKHVAERRIKQVEKEKKPRKKPLEKMSLPKPTGWRILVLPYKAKQKTKGGIILSDKTVSESQIATNCGLVMEMGPDAYNDKDKFPNGPWCKKKDWVLFARYAGSRIYIDGGEIRVLNDDEILGTIEDPEDILHALTV
jgi:co-chaperonin GroES (HSP10)|tara:strand:+ start:388 stop:819 length:432 start_codon:yes stop_codon:yes gene_type:complete